MNDVTAVRRGHGEKLALLWDRAIVALVTHSRISEAARSIGVRTDTLRKWLAVPEFADHYASAKREALDETIAALRIASTTAVKTLIRNMKCGQPAAEIAAARAILDCVLKPAGVHPEDGRVPVHIEIVYAKNTQVNVDGRQAD